MYIIKRIFLVIFLFFCSTSVLMADSLWQNKGMLYGNNKKEYKVGDIITVYISESTTALQEATTRTGKQSSIGSNFTNNWDQIANLLGNETVRKADQFQFGGSDDYNGTGKTSRQSQLKAVLSAVITEILENGNLYIVGEHQVKVNDEIETIRIAGVIRPGDIKDNSVNSSQIAKAQVSLNGAGVVGSKQTPGILSKMFNWLF